MHFENERAESNTRVYVDVKEIDENRVHIGGYADGKIYHIDNYLGTATSDDGDKYTKNSCNEWVNEETGEKIW